MHGIERQIKALETMQATTDMQQRTIMIVTCQDRETSTSGKVPKTERLVVTGRQNPWELSCIWMELNRSNVIQMAEQSKEAASQLVVPDLSRRRGKQVM